MSSSFFRKPIILIDADNVLYHWEKRFISDVLELDATYPIIEFGQRTGMEMVDKNGREADITVRVKTRPGFYFDLDPIEGARAALEAMEAAGYDVFICTAPSLSNPTCASDKHAAITRDFGRKWADRTIITKDKTLVRGDLLIDDKPEVTGVMDPVWQHVVFDQSYNRHVTDKARLVGWDGWETVLVPLLAAALEDAVS